MVERNASSGQRSAGFGSDSRQVPRAEAGIEDGRPGQARIRYEAPGDSGRSSSCGGLWTGGGPARATRVLPGADDQPDGVALYGGSVDLKGRQGGQFREEVERDLLGGLLVLKHRGAARVGPTAAKGLYRRYSPEAINTRDIELKFIPYYAWANRTETAMQVWTPVLKA